MKTQFEIVYKGEAVHVVSRKIGPDMVYILHFASRRPPLMLAKATRQLGGHFWTTIPEEREKARQEAVLLEAAVLGGLITEHYSKVVIIPTV